MQLILIALGGALATLLANVSGAFVLGLLATLFLERMDVSTHVRLGITVGVLGAYTTFSTFSLETLDLFNDGEWHIALLYVVASVAGALAAVWAGQALARV